MLGSLGLRSAGSTQRCTQRWIPTRPEEEVESRLKLSSQAVLRARFQSDSFACLAQFRVDPRRYRVAARDMEDDATESVTAHAREAELSARRYIETVAAQIQQFHRRTCFCVRIRE